MRKPALMMFCEDKPRSGGGMAFKYRGYVSQEEEPMQALVTMQSDSDKI